MKKELTQTIETRLPRDVTEKYDAILSEFAAIYSRALRSMVSRKNKGQAISKSGFMSEFGLTGRQFNAIKSEVDGLFKSQKSNYERYIVEAHQKNEQRSKRIIELRSLIADKEAEPHSLERQAKLFKLYKELRGCQNRIVKSKHKIAKWLKLIDNKQISVCFGSKRLFGRQHELEANDYTSHSEWLADFVAKRDSEFFLLGSKDEANGNQSCTITQSSNGLFDVRLRLPTAMESEFGKHLSLTHIPFNYRQEKLNAVVESNQIRKALKSGWKKNQELIERHARNVAELTQRHDIILQRMTERGDDLSDVAKAKESYEKVREKFSKFTEGNALRDFGKALSCRFKRDKKGWRVILSISYEVDAAFVSERSNGAIGVDLNEHHFAVAEIDNRGSKVDAFDLYFRDKTYDDSSNQTKSGIGEAVAQITRLAVENRKPIVIENLDFKAKKSQLKSGKETQYNKMVSSLVTARFLSILKLRCAEKGIELIQVNAAYTSFIGRLKYNVEVDFNVHQAAAMVIARRGVGFKDRHLPKLSVCLVRKEQMFFPVPKDSGKGEAFAYFKKVRQAYNKWFTDLWALSAASQRTAPQIALCESNPF